MAAGNSTGLHPQDSNSLPWGSVLCCRLPALMTGKTATVDGRPAYPGLADGRLCILQNRCLMESLQHLHPALSHVRAGILT